MSPLSPTGRPRLSEEDMYGAKPCAMCARNGATTWCSSCSISDIGDVRVFYCNYSCQPRHKSEHEALCKTRQRLGRAVKALLQAWTAYHTATNYKDYRVAYEVQNKIFLGKWNVSLEALATGMPVFSCNYETRISKHCVGPASEKAQMALRCINDCYQPSTMAFPFVEFFLKDVGMLAFLVYEIKDPAVVFHYATGSLTGSGHEVLIIRLPPYDEFVIDLTGAQYGWEEIIVPWDAYYHHRVGAMWNLQPLKQSKTLNYKRSDLTTAIWEIRSTVAQAMAETGRVYLSFIQLTMKELLDLPLHDFSEYCYDLLEKIMDRVYDKLQELYDEGFGRWFLQGLYPHVTWTAEAATKCKKLWVSSEKLDRKYRAKEDLLMLLGVWEEEFPGT